MSLHSPHFAKSVHLFAGRVGVGRHRRGLSRANGRSGGGEGRKLGWRSVTGGCEWGVVHIGRYVHT
jgi:hypothetical protein